MRTFLSSLFVPLGLFLFFSLLCVSGVQSVDDGTEQKEINKNEMGMEVLFNMVHFFLGDIVHTDKITDSFLNLSTVVVDGKVDMDQLENWEEWLDYGKGFAACLIIGLIYIVVMLVTGIIFCCCRTCGKCGARPKAVESKRGKCKRRSYCFVLSLLNTVILAGVVCAFVCVSLINKNVQNDNNEGIIGHLKSNLGKFEHFINESFQETTDYVNDKYDLTSSQILTKINTTGMNAVDEVLDQLNATQLINEAKDVAKEANATRDVLDAVAADLGELRTGSDQLKQNLTDIKVSIAAVCQPTSKCPEFDVNSFNTDADFSQLSLLQDEANKVSASLGMDQYIAQAEDEMDKAKVKAETDVASQTDEATKAVTDLRKTITDNLDELGKEKDSAIEQIPQAYKTLDDSEEDLKEYMDYIYYGGIGVCCVFLLIVVLYYIGVMYGLCGERPGDDAPCCHTGVGANCLMAGAAFTFIFAWILMLLCVILFAVGGPSYTEVCRYFESHNPEEVRFLDDVLKHAIDFKSFYKDFPDDFSVATTLEQCQNNTSLYTALDLDNVVNLDEMLNLTILQDKLDEFQNSNINMENITILSQDLEDKLKKFANAGLNNIPFDDYFAELNKNLTVADLPSLAANLRKIADHGVLGGLTPPDQQKLRNNADKLDELNSKTLPEMKATVDKLKQALTDLQQKSTLEAHVNKLVEDLKQAQDNFNSNKNVFIKDKVNTLADDIMTLANTSLSTIKKEIRTNLIKCQPLSDAVYGMTDSVCVLALDPYNGLWFSIGWCLFFLIPALVFAVLLASQYRRELEYEKDFDEPNYQMYGGHTNDTIPLTSMDNPQYQHNGGAYPPYHASRHMGQTNTAYNPGPMSPPPYNDPRSQQGIDAYARSVPYGEMGHPGHNHHDLARAYPALHADHKKPYYYPY